ncbi:MAG: ATP-dependent metallopeptidase FtsH/Yme1/Tma family protein, partial [Firmicutes bacterium]|nr:ATP-dependent metallopeptidase FtsH/Yme1/Tma family protein [Bacillota bacterium]
MNRLLKNTTIFLLLVLIVLSAYTWGSNKEDVRSLTYSDFCQMVEEGQIREVSISADYEAGRYTVNGTTVGGEAFRTILFPDPDIAAYLTENNVKISYDAVTTSWWVSMLATLIPMLLIVGLFVFLMQQGQGGGGKVMQFGKSRAKLQTDSRKKVTFDDVAGVDEVKEELEEIVGFLK